MPVEGQSHPVTAAAADTAFALKGRVALVTGASRGIGAGIAYGFIAAGARVAITHRGTARAEKEAAEMAARVGADVLFPVAADTSDPTSMANAVAQAAERFGHSVDTLVANAAFQNKLPWDQIPVEQWDTMMAVNLRGAFVAARSVVPGMRAAGYGKIITLGSVMAHIGDPRSLDYVTTKGGLIAFTRSLARAEGPAGIRVNCVAPGAILTERHFEDGGGRDLGRLADLQSVQRSGLPEDIAHACRYLASAAGDFVTGQVLAVDGGWAYP